MTQGRDTAYHDLYVPALYFKKHNLLECKVVMSLRDVIEHSHTVDIITFQRQYLPDILMLIRHLKRNGKVVTTICDDNIWELPRSNPAASVYKGATLTRYNAVLHEVHAVFTSTEYLKGLCLKHNPTVYIQRNLVELDIHNFVRPDKDEDQKDIVRILWHGTPHHHEDIMLVEPALRTITKQYPQVKWIFMGYKPPTIAQWCPPGRYEYYEFVHTQVFYPSIASLDADIGYAPLIGHPFNFGKTARKAQEFAILGIPMILAPIRTYAEWTHNVNCIKPELNTTTKWIEAFATLINMPYEEKVRLATNAYDFVVQNHDIDKFIFERAAAYYQIWNSVKNDNLILPTDTDWCEEQT